MSRALVESFLTLYEKMDRNEILDMLSDDVVISDPHFPFPTMSGKHDVIRGLNWSFGAIRKSNLNILNVSVTDSIVYVELDTTHYLKVGMKYHYLQILKFECCDSKITSITTYVTYSPGGARGMFRRGFALAWSVSDAVNNKLLQRAKPRTMG